MRWVTLGLYTLLDLVFGKSLLIHTITKFMFKKMLTASPYKFILLTSIFFLFLGAYNIIISKVSLPEITLCNTLPYEDILYFITLLLYCILYYY